MTITSFPATPEPDDEKRAPTTGASVTSRGVRSSAFPEMSAASWVQGLFQNYAGLGYQLPFEVLSYVEILSTYNPDMSQAVDNVRTLANSGHELFVDVAAERTARRIKSRLESKAKEIQGQHGGIDGLIDKLLDQAATYGAMCGEWVTTEDLSDVTDFVDVNPKTIRFFWDEDTERFAPFQKVNALQQEDGEEAWPGSPQWLCEAQRDRRSTTTPSTPCRDLPTAHHRSSLRSQTSPFSATW
jgi:hypothetical protein